MPYQKAAYLLNRIQHRNDEAMIAASTLNRYIVSWGDEIHRDQIKQSAQALFSSYENPRDRAAGFLAIKQDPQILEFFKNSLEIWVTESYSKIISLKII